MNAVSSVGGRPVAALRVSFADERERHQGVSHHTLTALARVALAPAVVAVPVLEDGSQQTIDRQMADAGLWARHSRADVAVRRLPDVRGVPLATMRRSPEDDPAFFAAAAAAGYVAAEMVART